MKKIIAICLMLTMLFGLSVNVFAANNGFVSSPTANAAPKVEEFKPDDEDCTADLVITPYSEIDELSQALQESLKQAYDSVKDSKDISKLNAELAKLAKDKKIKGENLAVSDLFDINIEGCTEHDDHDKFTIVLKADTLKNFVALLHMNKDGKWELVKDAKVNGDKLEFSIDGFSPFAIVVDTTTSTNAPLTADNTTIYFVVGIVAVAALAMLVVAAKNRKQKA